MNLQHQFNLKRFGLLVKKDTLESYRQGLIIGAAVFGVFLIIYLISMFTLARGGEVTVGFSPVAMRNDFHFGLFTPLLFIGGFIFTSRAFYESHSRVRSHDWFMLPASTLEKFTERLALSSVGYALGAALLYTLFSIISAGISQAIFKASFPIFNPLTRTAILLMLNYIVVQSIFLLGAAYFRKNHFVKTVAFLIASAIILGILAAVAVRFVYWDYFKGLVPTGELEALFEGNSTWRVTERLENLGRAIELTAKIFYWVVFAPLLWIVAHTRLREVEVKDGV
ncbi:MAG: hypothetical protein HN368_04280 [Spirochaetales bacterium]|jgi:hypothetical protein|nr:hypothetical protein [Spirochaetales bacterium]